LAPGDGARPDRSRTRRSWPWPTRAVGRTVVVAERRAHLTAPTAADHVGRVWEADVLPTLQEYIRIPNVSPAFDPDWATTGHMDRAVELVRAWMAARPIDGLRVSVERLPGRTPLIIAELPATDPA